MFAVMYEVENEKRFELCKTLDEAQIHGAVVRERFKTDVTIFDYDIDEKTFHEFYTVKYR